MYISNNNLVYLLHKLRYKYMISELARNSKFRPFRSDWEDLEVAAGGF